VGLSYPGIDGKWPRTKPVSFIAESIITSGEIDHEESKAEYPGL